MISHPLATLRSKGTQVGYSTSRPTMMSLKELLLDSSWPKAMVDDPHIRRRIMLINPVTTTVYGVLWTILLLPVYAVVGLDWVVRMLVYIIFRKNLSELRLTPEVAAALNDPRWGKHMIVKANGLKFHAVAKGEHGKPLMLFLHGFPENWYTWRHQLEALGSTGQYYCVAVDMRGYGESDKPKGSKSYLMEEIVTDVEAIVHKLGYEKMILVGHDWGANASWHIAHAYPNMVSRLVIMNFPHPLLTYSNFSVEQFFRSAYIYLFQIPVLPELMLRAINYVSFDIMFGMPGLGVKHREHMTALDINVMKYLISRPGALTSAINYYRHIFTYRQPHLIQPMMVPLEMPTLVVWGCQDAFLSFGMTQRMKQKVKNLRQEFVPDASHWVQNDRPDVVNGAIQAFLKAEGVEAGLIVPRAAVGLASQQRSRMNLRSASASPPKPFEPLSAARMQSRRRVKNVPSPPHAASVLVQ